MSQGTGSDLVIDVGTHNGQDSDFYLKLGYRVVAIEANPALVEKLQERFSEEIAQGRMTLVNKAISEQPGQITFYVNRRLSEWGTTDPAWAERNRGKGAESDEITVESIPFSDVLSEYGCPHYVKIDIEGADMICIEHLKTLDERPEYVSIESNKVSWAGLLAEFDAFARLGYDRFKVVDQRKHGSGRYRTRNGAEIDYRFEKGASGPFGENLPGPWLDREEALRHYRKIFLTYRLMGDNTLLERLLKKSARGRRLLNRVSWYDTHAKLSA